MREHETLFLAEAYGWSREEIMAMPSSERHRYMKWKEEITRQQNAKNKGSTVMSSLPTGIPTRATPPAVNVGYSGTR